jgi:hypothetical protein
MERELSSRGTFVAKYVFPGILMPLVSIQVVASFRRTGHLPLGDFRGVVSPSMVYGIATLWFLGCVFIFWFNMSLKRVRLADGAILVSNYIDEWRVPFGLIESVSQNRWFRPRPITIRLRADIGCGTSVKFMPPRRWFPFSFWREDSVVAELRQLAGVSKLTGR